MDELSVTLITGAQEEQAVLTALRRLRGRYDLKRFELTSVIRIERGVIPHSHPVLTLSDRYGGDDDFLLTTYLHEQLHWWSLECPGAQDGRDEAVYGRLEREYSVPLDPPEGCGDLLSNLIHLHVCWLELEAVSMFLGRERTTEILRSLWYYRAIYRTVLENDERLGALFNAEGMGLPPAP